MAKTGRFDFKDLFKWGGFPSSHSALVSCLATVVWILSGPYSSEFAISIAFGVIVVRDAMGLRMFVQANSRAINQIRETLSPDVQRKVAEQEHSVGHTKAQVAGGIVFGVAVALAWYWIFGF